VTIYKSLIYVTGKEFKKCTVFLLLICPPGREKATLFAYALGVLQGTDFKTFSARKDIAVVRISS
jgi:hypothetical protein